MKPSRFRRFSSLLLAVLVLTASVGLTVQRHTCRFSRRSKVQVALPGQVQTGCSNWQSNAPARIKSSCCDFSSYLHKLSAPAHAHSKLTLPVPPLLTVWPVGQAWQPTPVHASRPVLGAPRWYATDSSPPLAGRQLLAFVSMLIV